MNRTLVWWGGVLTVALGAAPAATSVAGCGGGGRQGLAEPEARTASQGSALTATFPATVDGGAPSVQTLQVKWKYPDPLNPNATDYGMWIGQNFHRVTGCASDATIRQIIPTVQPIQAAGNEQRAMSDDEPTPVVVEQPRAQFSCLTSDNGGTPDFGPDLPLGTTFYTVQLAGSQRVYFPTGAANEYYAYDTGDACLAPLSNALFKINDRENDGDNVFLDPGTRPADLKTEIDLSCGAPTTSNNSYALHFGYDGRTDANGNPIIPGQATCAPTDPTCQFAGAYAVIESIEGAGRSTFLPVYRVNGKPIMVSDGTPAGNALFTPEFVALVKRFGVTLVPEDAAGVSQDDTLQTALNTNPNGTRLWDLCVPEVTGGDGGAPSCPFQHFVYPPLATDGVALVTATVNGYRETTELEGTVYQDLLGNPPRTTFDPYYPSFAQCKGSFEAMFGLNATTAGEDTRAWVNTMQPLIQRNAVATVSPRFHCPAPPDPTSCQLTLGSTQVPSVALTLQALKGMISSTAQSCAASSLNITLNSNVDVTLAAHAGVSFDRFKEVTITSGTSGQQALTFHEACTPLSADNPCHSTGQGTRAVIPMTVEYPTRSLRFDRIALGYVADNADADADAGGTPFNLTVILIRMDGDSTNPAIGRDRVIFADSTIAADPASQTYVSQTLEAESADIYVVRSTLGGTSNGASFWKTIQMNQSLLVATGTTGGVATTPAQILGAGGALGYSTGQNDVLTVNARLQGPIISNGISQAIFYDTTLQRTIGKEALHFTGYETAGIPSRPQMQWFRSSNVVNLGVPPAGQKSTLPSFVLFDREPVTPNVIFLGTVKFWDPEIGTNQIVPSTSPSSKWASVNWCTQSKGYGALTVSGLSVCNLKAPVAASADPEL